MMTKTGSSHCRYTSLKQEWPLTGTIQTSLHSFLIRLLICYIGFTGMFTSVSSEMNCSSYEMQSLLAFKTTLHDPLGRLGSWNASLSCCEWEGVSCDKRTGQVVAVDLHNCNLSGAFFPE